VRSGGSGMCVRCVCEWVGEWVDVCMSLHRYVCTLCIRVELGGCVGVWVGVCMSLHVFVCVRTCVCV